MNCPFFKVIVLGTFSSLFLMAGPTKIEGRFDGSVENFEAIHLCNSHIYGNVVSSEKSTLGVGCSISNSTIDGDLTLASGSIFTVNVSSNAVSILNVTGNVIIEDDVSVVFIPTAGCYTSSDFNFLVAGGSLTGAFSSASVEETFLLSPSLFYSQFVSGSTPFERVSVGFTRLPLLGFATQANSRAVASALDVVIPEDVNEFGSFFLCNVMADFFFVGSEELSSFLNEIQPALFKGLTISQQNNAVKVQDALSYRMQNELDGVHCSFLGSCSKENNPFHIWADAFGDILYQDSIFYAGSSQIGYQTKTAGAVLGGDRCFLDCLYVGALGGYTSSNTHFQTDAKGTVDTGYAGLYFSGLGKMFYGNLSVLGGWSHFTNNRSLITPNQVISSRSSYQGSQILSHADTGINLGWDAFTVRPFDSFDYISQTEGAHTESGAGELNISVEKSNAIMIRNEMGLQFAGCFCLGGGKWTFSPKISWVREIRVKGAEYNAQFINSNVPFQVTGYFPDRSLWSAGVSIFGKLLKDLLSVGLYYNGEFGEKYNDHSFGGQIRFALHKGKKS